jgi:hypothetical protein
MLLPSRRRRTTSSLVRPGGAGIISRVMMCVEIFRAVLFLVIVAPVEVLVGEKVPSHVGTDVEYFSAMGNRACKCWEKWCSLALASERHLMNLRFCSRCMFICVCKGTSDG